LAASKSVSQLTSAETKPAETKIIEQRRSSFFTSQVSANEAACANLPLIARRKGESPARETPGLHQKILFDMSGDELGHLEHTDLSFAVENGTKRIIGINLGSLLFILTTVFLDVVPQFFRELGTR
jgi:hypothetical protein